MPPLESIKDDHENVEYIVKGTSPVFSVMSIVTFILLICAIVLQYLELVQVFGYKSTVFF